VRNGLAGQALAKLLASLRKSTIPSFDTPNKSTTWIFTNHGHPEAQCRLDTYLAGATCTQSAHTDVSQTSITPGHAKGNLLEEDLLAGLQKQIVFLERVFLIQMAILSKNRLLKKRRSTLRFFLKALHSLQFF
jgi:hypothetical protein